MDLGLAQLADEVEGRLTRTRQFVGTLRYASPEQVLAVARLDRRSDVYSLGATLWELLTLRPLFGATEQTPTPELMEKIQIEEPERVRKHNPAVPRDLEAVVHKCLEKDPKTALRDGGGVGGGPGGVSGGRAGAGAAGDGTGARWKWARRRPAQAAALVLTVLALVGLAVGGALFAWQAEQARVEAEYSCAGSKGRMRREADDKRDEADRHAGRPRNRKARREAEGARRATGQGLEKRGAGRESGESEPR